ncbi:hypothetical protein ACFL20_05030 [Spirochaetota bacterium]
MADHHHGEGIDKLKVLLPHLRKHNDDHISDLGKWIEEAERAGLNEVASDLKRVLELSNDIDKCFESAIMKIS